MRGQADQMEAQAMVQAEERRARLINAVYRNMAAGLRVFEERVRQAEEQDRQTNAEKAEWISLAQTIRSDRLEDGSLRFGPQG